MTFAIFWQAGRSSQKEQIMTNLFFFFLIMTNLQRYWMPWIYYPTFFFLDTLWTVFYVARGQESQCLLSIFLNVGLTISLQYKLKYLFPPTVTIFSNFVDVLASSVLQDDCAFENLF